MTTRDHIKDRTKLASALCILLEIPYEHQLMMHEEHVLSLVQWDHYPKRKADGGGDLFSNLQPLLIGGHREKTATRDIPEIAKGKRLVRSEKDRGARLAAKLYGTPAPTERPKRRIPSRPFPKVQRKLQGSNSFQRRR